MDPANFALSEPSDGNVQLWALGKNNTTYRVQRLASSMDELAERWNSAWEAVYFDAAILAAQTSGPAT